MIRGCGSVKEAILSGGVRVFKRLDLLLMRRNGQTPKARTTGVNLPQGVGDWI